MLPVSGVGTGYLDFGYRRYQTPATLIQTLHLNVSSYNINKATKHKTNQHIITLGIIGLVYVSIYIVKL